MIAEFYVLPHDENVGKTVAAIVLGYSDAMKDRRSTEVSLETMRVMPAHITPALMAGDIKGAKLAALAIAVSALHMAVALDVAFPDE